MGTHDERLKELTAEHGELRTLAGSAGQLFAFRRPTADEWAEFMRAGGDDRRSSASALNNLAFGCLVYPEAVPGTPDTNAFTAYRTDRPAVSAAIVRALTGLAGATVDMVRATMHAPETGIDDPRALAVSLGGEWWVFRPPGLREWFRFFDSAAERGIAGYHAGCEMSEDCLIFPLQDGAPDRARLRALWTEYPALPTGICDALSDAAGLSARVSTVFGASGELAELEREHGELAELRDGDRLVWFRRPKADEWAEYSDGLAGQEKAHACYDLAESCVVSDVDAWRRYVADFPAVLAGLCRRLSALAGGDTSFVTPSRIRRLSPADRSALDEVAKLHPRGVRAAVVGGVLVAVTCPAPGAWSRYVDTIESDDAPAALIFDCLKLPTREAWAELVDQYPALLSSAAAACAELAGTSDHLDPKKT